MIPRPACCALLLAFALGCTRGSTPISPENPADSPAALARQGAETHTIVVLTQESDYYRDGTIDETYVIRTSYDQHGNALVVDEEANRGGSIRRKVTTSSYNRWGNVLEQVIDLAWPANGPRHSRFWITTVETDEWGRPSRQVYLLDYDQDGVPDHEGNTRSYPAYDHQGRPLQEILDFDRDADGALDTRTTQTMSYDQHGNAKQLTSESDWQMDGTSEHGFRWVSTYNAHGAVVQELSESYESGEGVAIYEMATTEFDSYGNPIVRVWMGDHAPADGIIDDRRVQFTSFDQRHRPLSQIVEVDLGADGTFESRITQAYEYSGTLAPRSTSMNAVFPAGVRSRILRSGERSEDAE